MNQLVFIENNQPITDSLTIAEMFEKRHDNVMADIRTQSEYAGEKFSLLNFKESVYESRGKQYPKMNLTEEAFTLVVFSYNTKEAVQAKIKFIQEFKQMKEKIQNNVHVLNERQSMIQSLKLTAETAEKQDKMEGVLTNHGEKITKLEKKVDNQITLSYGEQRRLQKAVARRVYELYDNPEERPKAFSGVYREIKDRFAVASYKDVRRKDLQMAINYVENWIPKRAVS